MSLLEASSIGRPIITSNVPGCNNIVFDGVNGFLCKPKDIMSLYNCIIKMINTTSKTRIKMGRNGRKLVEKNFDIKIINNLIINELI